MGDGEGQRKAETCVCRKALKIRKRLRASEGVFLQSEKTPGEKKKGRQASNIFT